MGKRGKFASTFPARFPRFNNGGESGREARKRHFEENWTAEFKVSLTKKNFRVSMKACMVLSKGIAEKRLQAEHI